MTWFNDLITNRESVSHSILIIMLVSAIGLAMGQIKIRGVSLGIAWVLFVGLGFAHFGLSAKPDVLHFLRDFGLILFVFTIGMQVGPGFFASLKKSGLPLNLAATLIVTIGVLLSIVQWKYFMNSTTSDLKAAVGLMSGATTNTPSMAAGSEAFAQLELQSDPTTRPKSSEIGSAYAISYPIGIFGVLLTMMTIRVLFKIDIKAEQRQLSAQHAHPTLDVLNLEVVNPALVGKTIGQIPTIGSTGVVITRLMRNKKVDVAGPDQVLQIGDILTAVGPTAGLSDIEIIVGKRTHVDARAVSSDISVRRILVSRRHTIGKTIDELGLFEKYNVQVTRISRSGFELPVTPMITLQYGDRVTVVGETQSMPAVISELGDSPRQLDKPILIPILLGIVLGVVFGSIPIMIPGLPAPLKLGLAGGPLVIAILLSRVYKIGPLIWYMPNGANMFLREFGIVLFLACVGLLSGETFVSTFKNHGLQWILIGASITIIPVMLVGIIARAVFKMNYLTLVGLLAGSMTDPPALAFAQDLTGSDAPTISYATVYPLVMLLRVMSTQIMVLLLAG